MMTAEPANLYQLAIATAEGEFTASYSTQGLAGLSFPGRSSALRQSPGIPRSAFGQISAWHRLTTKALKMALAGRQAVELPPLDFVTGTDFQQQVWRAMRQIPLSKTSSYGELAKAIGRPKAVRAVGGACGANPIPVFIPCHRVLAAGGRLGGFSGGLDWKRRLLAAEGLSRFPGDST
jgi:O-6-methylguanine DNA methyltransferase